MEEEVNIMAKKNSIIMRIDADLAQWVRDIAQTNSLSDSQASKELAKLRKRLKEENRRVINEIKF